jgi:hypothetical protein
MDMEGIVAIVGTFLTPLVLGPAYFVMRYRIERERNATMRALVEKGVPIPEQWPAPPPASARRRGVLLMAFALASVAPLAYFVMPCAAGLALFPFMIGAGYLVVWKLERRDETSQAIVPARAT